MYQGVSHAAAMDTQFLPLVQFLSFLALKVLVGEEGPDPELLALKVLVRVSSCWSGTAGLYRPGILLDSRPIWNGEFSLVSESPTIREGGYTAVRMVDVVSLVSGSGWVAPAGTDGTAAR